jgi:DNA-binding NtrC family response regulator
VKGAVRVLWLDPDVQAVAEHAHQLERSSWSITHAHTFLDALDQMTQAAFDIAIIDLNLPDAVGTDVWQHIKKLNPQMRGIITTSSPSLRQFVAVDEPGILAYLLKPLEMESVVSIIDQAIGR